MILINYLSDRQYSCSLQKMLLYFALPGFWLSLRPKYLISSTQHDSSCPKSAGVWYKWQIKNPEKLRAKPQSDHINANHLSAASIAFMFLPSNDTGQYKQ